MNILKSVAHAFTLTAALSLASLAHAAATTVFVADFEGDLSAWTERDPGAPTGQIVADPLNAGHGQVLNFQRTGSSGTLFTADAVTSNSGWFQLNFEYLGLPIKNGPTDDLGGYIGAITQVSGQGLWVGGTGAHPAPLDLVDDGQWHSYTYTFKSDWGPSLRVMIEDWDGSVAQVAGDAFFDNISLRAVPEPTSLALVGLALAAMGASAKRRKA